ncbi:MAG: hypothetical protein WC460_06735 [Patescibacteria group bacterium]
MFRESISNSLEGISSNIICYADDQLGPIDSELISDDGVVVYCSNCGAVLFNSEEYDEENRVNQESFLFTHKIHGNLNEVIVKQGNEWCVKSKKKDKKGHRKNLGCYGSKAAAHKRLGQVEYFRNKGG